MLQHTGHGSAVPPDTGLEQTSPKVTQRHAKQLKLIADRKLKQPDGVIERTVDDDIDHDLVASRKCGKRSKEKFIVAEKVQRLRGICVSCLVRLRGPRYLFG